MGGGFRRGANRTMAPENRHRRSSPPVRRPADASLRQVDLATALGDLNDHTMISHVESGHSARLLDGLVKAASELSVSLDYLVRLTEDIQIVCGMTLETVEQQVSAG